ncbi:AI-2E family transporter [Virgisporangium aliadipatigenens]|uniref:AI-2E family transporter n=1 Tax=Virgisporangium aliadipatigenens TaxID=741659 RepID=A0A8J4DW02_9ACTN|nr:AI-2E family transporter [Virgisporangium aliadipatigenens]GIJ52359.1 AI-2E family transporter [Virgisporangium aliadipatigenens]
MGRIQQVAAGVRRAYDATRSAARARAEETAEDKAEVPPVDEVEGPKPEPLTVAAPSITSRDDSEVPKELRIAAAYAWRLIVLAIAAVGVFYLIGMLSHVVIPLAISLLLSALLSPLSRFLVKYARFPKSLAAGLVLVAGLGAVIGTLTLVVTQIVDKFGALSQNAQNGAERIRDWLQGDPLNLSTKQLDDAIESVTGYITENQGRITGSALSTVTTTIETLAAFFLVLFSTFFFIRDGDKIWRFLVRIFPREAERKVEMAGYAAWATLGAYVRATVLVAFIDALGIGFGLYVLDVTLWFPLGALVFLSAFIPVVGAALSGAVAILVTLVERDPLAALVALIIVIAVQQLEGHVLQPLIMGRAVAIHPLAVIVAIAAGAYVAGIIGALVAVPIVAVLNTAIRYLVLNRREPPPDAVVVASESTA